MTPVVFVWKDMHDEHGEVVRCMVPQARYAKVAARQYGNGEEYPLVPLEARSQASHGHYFAALHEGFQNLPENIAARWPSEEHLRKWILIETGWFHEKEFDFDTLKRAREFGRFFRGVDSYARISIHGTRVIVRFAKSQSMATMAKAEFEKSKQDVLGFIENMIDVEKGTLKKQAGKHG